MQHNWNAIVQSLLRHGTRRFCITGGEPSLFRELPLLLSLIRERGGQSSLIVADGEIFLRRLEEFRAALQFIRFSIHGIGALHDMILGRVGAFRSTEKAIAQVAGLIPFSISTVATKATLCELPQIAAFAATSGAVKLDVFCVLETGYGARFRASGAAATREEVEAMVCDLERGLEPSLPISVYGYNEGPECVLVYPDGEIRLDPWPGSPTNQLSLGNVLRDDLLALWGHAQAAGHLAYLHHLEK